MNSNNVTPLNSPDILSNKFRLYYHAWLQVPVLKYFLDKHMQFVIHERCSGDFADKLVFASLIDLTIRFAPAVQLRKIHLFHPTFLVIVRDKLITYFFGTLLMVGRKDINQTCSSSQAAYRVASSHRNNENRASIKSN